jgi:hypothetical protein
LFCVMAEARTGKRHCFETTGCWRASMEMTCCPFIWAKRVAGFTFH